MVNSSLKGAKVSVSPSKDTFFVSTPIYYPNDIPHIGHAYTTVAADVVARWHKLLGEEVFFLTGTDDHGKKIADTAAKQGLSPQAFTDNLVPKFKDAWQKLGVEYDQFIRTTDKDHEVVVQEVLQKCFDNGDIYKGEYEGLYCTGCEAYYTLKDVVDGHCPVHKRPVELIKEETYFFRLSKYERPLLDFFDAHPEFIGPAHRRQEIINRVKEGLKDLSISRKNFSWGVPLPFDSSHVCYVWFDALFNYYSATRYGGREGFWPCDVHLIGKDILWFHTVYWPAFLLSAGISLPKKVFAHGWWTFNKEKISKSVGRVVNVDELIAFAGVDAARFFLFRESSFGEDGDFSSESLINRYHAELANKYGNLVSRVSTLAEKYGLAKAKPLVLNIDGIKELFSSYQLDKALNEVLLFIDQLNEFVQSEKPWESHDKKVLYTAVTGIRDVTILLSPFIPGTAKRVAEEFGFSLSLDELSKPLTNSKIKKSSILFSKIEAKPVVVDAKINKSLEPREVMPGITSIQYADFEKLDVRVAQIFTVEDISGADKLYKLTISLGDEFGQRTICAGIKPYYTKEQLLNKKIIVLANLEPRKLKGIESQGMLLAAGSKETNQCLLLVPDGDVPLGTKVS